MAETEYTAQWVGDGVSEPAIRLLVGDQCIAVRTIKVTDIQERKATGLGRAWGIGLGMMIGGPLLYFGDVQLAKERSAFPPHELVDPVPPGAGHIVARAIGVVAAIAGTIMTIDTLRETIAATDTVSESTATEFTPGSKPSPCNMRPLRKKVTTWVGSFDDDIGQLRVSVPTADGIVTLSQASLNHAYANADPEDADTLKIAIFVHPGLPWREAVKYLSLPLTTEQRTAFGPARRQGEKRWADGILQRAKSITGQSADDRGRARDLINQCLKVVPSHKGCRAEAEAMSQAEKRASQHAAQEERKSTIEFEERMRRTREDPIGEWRREIADARKSCAKGQLNETNSLLMQRTAEEIRASDVPKAMKEKLLQEAYNVRVACRAGVPNVIPGW